MINGQIKKMHYMEWERAEDGRNLFWEPSDA